MSSLIFTSWFHQPLFKSVLNYLIHANIMNRLHGVIEENIALLALLNAKVAPLTQQLLLPERRDSMNPARRTLTLKHEEQAAKAFAILFANTDSPDEVGAVCVEEKFDRSGLIVRTATNSGLQTT